MVDLTPTHPLSSVLPLPSTAGQVMLTVDRRAGVCLVMARKGRTRDVADTMRASESAGIVVNHTTHKVLPIAPGEWLCLFPTDRDGVSADRLANDLNGIADVSDQGHARCIIRIEGPNARQVLAKGCRLDLADEVFGHKRCVVTGIAHITVLLARDGNAFDLIVPGTTADSFWHWLLESATEFGPAVKVIR